MLSYVNEKPFLTVLVHHPLNQRFFTLLKKTYFYIESLVYQTQEKNFVMNYIMNYFLTIKRFAIIHQVCHLNLSKSDSSLCNNGITDKLCRSLEYFRIRYIMLDAIFRKIENLKSKKFNVFRTVKESTSVVQYTKTYKSKNLKTLAR